ncbi:MAG: ATP-binding protein [Aeromicrobium sp.]
MSSHEHNADHAAAQDELLVRAAEAVNRGELTEAHVLAGLVLSNDGDNLDAGALLATESQPAGEVRRLTVMFCDLVGSTTLSSRLDPELYRGVLHRYRRLASAIAVERHGGFVTGFQGDGMLALFGYPIVRGNDTERGVIAALEIAAEVAELSDHIAPMIGEPLAVRAVLHRGLLYIDPEQDDVYGHAVNVASRLQHLAEPGEVVVSDEVRMLVADRFEMTPGEAQEVKGLDEPLQPFKVVGRKSSEPLSSIRTPMVGRSAEFEKLRAMWRLAQESRSSMVAGVTIVGDAGIGKSRLAEAIADDVKLEGGTVVSLAGSSDHEGVGYHPVRRLIERRCRIGASSTAEDQLARLEQDLQTLGFAPHDTVPLLAPVLGIDPEAGYTAIDADGQKLTDDIAKACVEYVLACLGEGPALLVVEDHHDVDAATDDLIGRTMSSGRPQTFVVATSRTGPAPHTDAISLGALSWDACIALIDALAPADGRLAGSRAELVDRSDGVPLFLEELVRGSATEAVDVRHRPARSAASTVPDVLYEPLMARLHASPATVAVASTAATIGRDVDIDLLIQSVGLPSEQVRQAVESLVGGLILEGVAGDGDSVRFRHELVREVAYDLLSPSRRREVHARVADALIASAEQDERSDWTIIANHFERSDRPRDAANAWREAADDARRRGLAGEARLRLGAAIDQVGRMPAGPERSQLEVELRLQRGYLASSTEGLSSPDATLDYSRCMELTLESPDAPHMASTLNAMWAYYTSRADLARARQASDILASISGGDWGSSWQPVNAAGYGMLDWWEGKFHGAAGELQQAIDLLAARKGLDEEVVAAWYVPMHPTVAIHVHLAIARFMDGDTVGADTEGELALAMSKDIPFPRGQWTAAYTQWMLSWMYMERGDHDRSFALLAEVASIGEQHGFDIWSLIATTQHAATTAARNAGEAEGGSTAGQAMLGSLIDACRAVEYRNFLTVYITVLGRLAAKAGDVESARVHYEESLELAESTGMRFYDAETLRCRAHLADQADQVVRGLTEALALARQQGTRPFELRIALDLHDVRGEAAAAELRAAVDGFAADASYAELDDARSRLARLKR